MLKIRLSRAGKKNRPVYRVVIQEARSKRDGKAIDRLGYYRPLEQPAAVKIDAEKYRRWIEKGAQPTETVRRLFKKAGAR